MKLKTRRYSVNTCCVLVPERICNAPEINKDIGILRGVAEDEYARLKDGITVCYDSMTELAESEDFKELSEDFRLVFERLLSDEFKQVDEFVFHN